MPLPFLPAYLIAFRFSAWVGKVTVNVTGVRTGSRLHGLMVLLIHDRAYNVSVA